MRHNNTIIAVLIIAIMAATVPVMAQSTPFPPDNRPYGLSDLYLPNNPNPRVRLGLAIDLRSDSLTWTREDYFCPTGWRLNSGGMALPRRWLRPTRGPHWGFAIHGLYDAPTGELTSWCGPFIGSQNFRFCLMTNLDHDPGQRYGAFVFLRY